MRALAGLGYIMGGLVDAPPETTVERPHTCQYHVSKNLKGFKLSRAGCAGAVM